MAASTAAWRSGSSRTSEGICTSARAHARTCMSEAGWPVSASIACATARACRDHIRSEYAVSAGVALTSATNSGGAATNARE